MDRHVLLAGLDPTGHRANEGCACLPRAAVSLTAAFQTSATATAAPTTWLHGRDVLGPDQVLRVLPDRFREAPGRVDDRPAGGVLDPAVERRVAALPVHLRREFDSIVHHAIARLEHQEPEDPNTRPAVRGLGQRYTGEPR